MTDPVWVSSGAFDARTVADVVRLAVSSGVTHVELGSGLAWSEDVVPAVRSGTAQGLRFLVHNYFPPHRQPFVLNLAATRDEDRARSVDHCRRAIDLAAELGAPFFSVHAGFAADARPGDLGRDLTHSPRVSLDEAQEAFVPAVREVCAYGAAKGVRLLVENNVVAPFNLVDGRNVICLGATAPELLRIVREVAHPNLGLLVDVGHAKVSATALRFDVHAFLDTVAPHVEAFHLSDNDGNADTNEPFDEQAWFVPRLADFPAATMVIEAYRIDAAQIRRTAALVAGARRPQAARQGR